MALRHARAMHRRGKAVVLSVHTPPSLVYGAFSFGSALAAPYRRYLRRAARHVDMLISPSAFTAEEIKPIAGGVPIRVVSSGVDLTRFSPDPEKRRAFRAAHRLDRPTVISVGQVIPRKGVEDFIAVARSLPQFDFLWVGPEVNPLLFYNPQFNRRVHHPPANLRFLGYMPEVERAYNGADLFFFPSYNESLGLVILEAAAVGLPLVVRDLPVYNGWLPEGEAVRKGRSPEEFAEAITELLSGERSFTRHPFVEEHSLLRVGAELVSAYEEVLG